MNQYYDDIFSFKILYKFSIDYYLWKCRIIWKLFSISKYTRKCLSVSFVKHYLITFLTKCLIIREVLIFNLQNNFTFSFGIYFSALNWKEIDLFIYIEYKCGIKTITTKCDTSKRNKTVKSFDVTLSIV